jgi:hypothetical protein
MTSGAASRSSAIAPLPVPSGVARAERHLPKFVKSGLMLGGIASVLLTIWILAGLGGFDYYRTPVSVRAYVPAHRLLRPSGPAGQMFGVVGVLLMLVPFAYVARKRIRAMKNVGSLKGWLEVHLFCGVVGPVLVTFHTAFKFNGIVSAAYWSMVLVMLSGFVGRFLYVRIPRTLRGVELTKAELESHAEELRQELARSIQSEELTRRIETFEHAVQPAHPSFSNLLFGEFAVGRRIRAFEKELISAELSEDLRTRAVAVAVERAMLLRRTAYLKRTKQLFDLWHVFHLPFVYLLLIIVAAHVAVVLYLGYVPFRW